MKRGTSDGEASQRLPNIEDLFHPHTFELHKRLKRRRQCVIALTADERAVSMQDVDEAECLEGPDRFPYGGLTDSEPIRKILLAW